MVRNKNTNVSCYSYCNQLKSNTFIHVRQGALCDYEVGVTIFNPLSGNLFQYRSVEMEILLQRYASYRGPSTRLEKGTVRVKPKLSRHWMIANRNSYLSTSLPTSESSVLWSKFCKSTSNIPVEELELAGMALRAATAASYRPRRTFTFQRHNLGQTICREESEPCETSGLSLHKSGPSKAISREEHVSKKSRMDKELYDIPNSSELGQTKLDRYVNPVDHALHATATHCTKGSRASEPVPKSAVF